MNEKYIKIIISIFIITAVFVAGYFSINNLKNIKEVDQLGSVVKQKEEIKNTTIYFVGDIMLTRGVESSVNKNFNGDFSKLFENLTELKKSDILFGNLEGAVSDKGNNVGSKYSFRMNPNVLPILKNAGFDIVSFANNHVGDWNKTAFNDTLDKLNEKGILKTGAGINKQDAESPIIIEKNGVKFGFIGFSDVGPNWIEAKVDSSGILIASDPRIEEIIKNAKIKSDILIVSMHFGDEYKLIHNKRQETLAHLAIDNGADMVIGHHPHVIEDIEIYKEKTIVYSLGNFIFDQYFSKDTMRGMLFSATFKGKDLINTEQKIITLNSKYQPEGIFTPEEVREKDELASNICPKPKKEYKDMSLENVGQNISLSDITYIPNNLRELNSLSSTKKGICLTKETRNAFEKLVLAAKEDGYTIKASSGFRSYEIQKAIYNEALKTNRANTLVGIAKPGYSEHQLGTTIDATSSSINYASATELFDETPESIWLEDNAYKFGFIRSYPKGLKETTGYKYEPWHYRYVGIENAKKIRDGKLTITEYLKSL